MAWLPEDRKPRPFERCIVITNETALALIEAVWLCIRCAGILIAAVIAWRVARHVLEERHYAAQRRKWERRLRNNKEFKRWTSKHS